MTTSTCRACNEPIRPGRLACRPHWYALPKPLRDAIWATWRVKDRRVYLEHVREAERLWAAEGIGRRKVGE